MSVEQVGPGGVSNSYGVRTTTSKVVYENDNTYQDVFIPTGSVPVTVTSPYQGFISETASTFATISTSMRPRTIVVIADETNDGLRTTYIHDGFTLSWLPTVEII